jgi:ubiquinone/menaquinone biosynthesis C-methylase UbiE
MPNQWEQKRSAMRHYDQTAETYNRQYTEEQNTKIIAALNALPQLMDESAVILDVGCGTGTLFPHTAEKTKQTIGIDISIKLLKKAKEAKKTHNNVALTRADADFLPFKTETFTHTFAFTLIQNMPNPKRTLEEIKRVTRRDATLVITGLKKHFKQTAFVKLLENARLGILTLKTDEELKDFVAVCRKRL